MEVYFKCTLNVYFKYTSVEVKYTSVDILKKYLHERKYTLSIL